jgi:RND family efflux transporter MFP subunit
MKLRNNESSMIARLSTVLILAAFLMSGCGTRQEERPPPPAIKVGVAIVERGEIRKTFDLSGIVRFIANTGVSSQVSAQVKSIDVRDGQPVKQGQTLLTFDDTTIRAVADQARGNLQKDQATLVYNKNDFDINAPLLKTGSISQATYDQKLSLYQSAVGQVEADKGALAKAEEDLKHTIVTAPITGVLSNRYVEKGDWVSTAGKLFQLSDYSTVYIEAFLSDKDVSKLDVNEVLEKGQGGETEFTVDSLPGKKFKGKVGYIQAVTNQNRLFEVRIYRDNQDMQLLEGMYARARIVFKHIPDVVRVPLDALLQQIRSDQANSVVRVSKDDLAEIIPVRIGDIDSAYAEVLNGLQPGDRVVLEGKEVLTDGQRLEATKVSAPPS